MKSPGHQDRANHRKIDVSLLDRRKVLQCLEAVRGSGPLSKTETDVLAHKLAQLGRIVPATLIHALETEGDRAIVSLAAQTLECMAEADSTSKARCIAGIKRLVLSAGVPDDTRVRLLSTLSNLGVDIYDMRYAAAFDDFAAMAETSREEMLSEVASDELLMGQLLEEIGRLPSDVRVSMIEDYAQSEQPVVLKLYRTLGRSDDPSTGRAVVDCLCDHGTREAGSVLQGLGQDALCPETRERAARALKAMRFAGVEPLPPVQPGVRSVCSSLVSAMDGVGSRMIWVARHTKRSSQLSVIHLMVNDCQGIKDCFGSSRTLRSDYEERVRSLQDPGEIACEAFDYDYCIALVRDALATNRRANSPVAPQFMLLMDVFSDRSLEPEIYSPRFDGINLSGLKSNQTAIKRSMETLELPALSTWFVVSQEVYALAARAARLAEPGRGNGAFVQDVNDQLGRMDRQVVLNELAPSAALLRRRMELMADYFLRSSRPMRDHAYSLLAVAQHLPAWQPTPSETPWPEDSLSPEENPFLIAIARRSLQNARTALLKGQSFQKQPEGF